MGLAYRPLVVCQEFEKGKDRKKKGAFRRCYARFSMGTQVLVTRRFGCTLAFRVLTAGNLHAIRSLWMPNWLFSFQEHRAPLRL